MKIKAVAHRGYPPKYPENTLSSYQAACDLGFERLELDAHLSKDGVPVMMHDIFVDRVTDGEGYIEDYTLDELKQLRVRENETVPTLKEALQLVKGKMIVSIELKQQGHLYPGLEKAVLDVVHECDMVDEVYINSFDHYAVERMRQLSKDVELGLIISGATPSVFPYMKEINAKYLSVKVGFITDEYVKACEDHGVVPIAWTVNTEEDIKRMLRYPSVLSTTDELELFKSLYEQQLEIEK